MTDRQPHPQLQAHFERLKSTPSDINEHLDTLYKLASKCEHVTEMGMRGAVSTAALLAAQPLKLISWDINPFAVVSQATADLCALAGRTQFQPRVGDTLEIVIESTEFLFIDTLHTAKQLYAELCRHTDPYGLKVSKYIAFHDTATFGEVDEGGGEGGLRLAIRKWQKEEVFPNWGVILDARNNNGLTVLAHVNANEGWL